MSDENVNTPLTAADLDERVSILRSELLARIEKTQITLLKEFRNWAVRIESAGRVSAGIVVGLEQRVAVLEERLNDLEDRPPRG